MKSESGGETERKTKRWTEPTIGERQRMAGGETKASETVNVGHKIKRSMRGKRKRRPTERLGRVRGEGRVRQLILCRGCAN